MRSIREQLIRSLSVYVARRGSSIEFAPPFTISSEGKERTIAFLFVSLRSFGRQDLGNFPNFRSSLAVETEDFRQIFEKEERESNVSLPGHWKFSCTRVAEFGADDPRVVHGRLKSNFTGADVR